MKRVMIVCMAIIICFCQQPKAFALFIGNLEKYLIVGDGVSAKGELRTLYKTKAINNDQLLMLLDFIDTGIVQSIGRFNDSYDEYIATKDSGSFDKIVQEYNQISSIMRKRNKNISRAAGYLSADFLQSFNDKISALKTQLDFATQIHIEETDKESAREEREQKEKELQQKKLEEQAIAEAKRLKDIELLNTKAEEYSKNCIEFQKPKLACEICSLLASKKECEFNIKREKKYANKYSVINLKEIEDNKVQIMDIDFYLKEKTTEYTKVTKTKFNFTECKNIPLECKEPIMALKEVLRKKYIAEHRPPVTEDAKAKDKWE